MNIQEWRGHARRNGHGAYYRYSRQFDTMDLWITHHFGYLFTKGTSVAIPFSCIDHVEVREAQPMVFLLKYLVVIVLASFYFLEPFGSSLVVIACLVFLFLTVQNIVTFRVRDRNGETRDFYLGRSSAKWQEELALFCADANDKIRRYAAVEGA